MSAYSSRQSTLNDGNIISAALFNNEFNAILNAFTYASTSTTGHRHDGTAGQGGNIFKIGDQDFLNKVVIESNEIKFFIEVGGAAVEQLNIVDGVLAPETTNDIDLGTSSKRFKTIYGTTLDISGTAVNTVRDEDNMASDDADGLATQQSIKAYVDAQTVSYGGIQLAVGGVDATPAFNLSDATNYPTSSLSGTIATAQIADDAVTNAKIADDAVDSAQIADSAIGSDQLAANSVIAGKLQTSSISTANIQAVAVTTAKIADDAVTTAKIATSAVTTTELNTAAITTDKLATQAVTGAKIANSAVDSDQIASGAIIAGKLENSAVATANIQANAVTTVKITDANITTAKIADDAVTTAKIADDAVDTAQLADGAVDTNRLGSAAVTSAKLATGGVGTLNIADSAVTEAKIADDAVTDAKLANSINSAITANTAKVTNATHTGEVTGDTALTIADNVVDEANLKVSNSPVNGYFLSAQSGDTGGLTWAAVSSGIASVVADSSPQLGGDLDVNGNEITGTGKFLDVTDTNNNILANNNSTAPTLTMKGYSNTATTPWNNITFATANGTTKGKITTNAYATQYSTSSDYRLKEDIQEVPNATARTLALKPCNFQWTGTSERTDGFLAHELAEQVPDSVTGEKDAVDADGNPDYQGIDQSKLVPLLVKTIQELEARISALESV